MVGKVVGGNRSTIISGRSTYSNSAIASTTSAKASAKASTCTGESSAKSSSTGAREPSTEPSSTTSATKSATPARHSTSESATPAPSASKAVLPHFELTSLPIVSVELGNCISGVLGRLESNNSATLGAAIRSNVNIRTNDGTCKTKSADCASAIPSTLAHRLGGRDP